MNRALQAGRFVAVVLASSLLASTSSRAASTDDRATADSALADIRATIAEIVRIEDGYAVGHDSYVAAAERARNGLLDKGDRSYVASVGTPSDDVGAIAHVDELLDRKDESVWTPAMQGAKMNMLAAVQSLSNALHEKQMEDYETDLTVAISDLSLAIGRSTDRGVLGGIQGALAATSLAVPAGASVVSGCRLPQTAPSYGLVDGNLTFVSVPRSGPELMIPSDIVVDRVSVLPKQLVLYTRPRAEQAKLCSVSSTAKAKVVPPAKLDVAPMPAHEAAAVSAPLVRLASDAQAMPSGDRMVAAADSAASPGSAPTYTAAQAHAGAAVYAKNCISCHGANLQGVAGPAIAGKDFLGGAVTNKWTFADLRNIVVQQMPLNNPGTLTPTQYADVLAFILASNCFPATAAPFPESDAPALAAAKVAPPAAPVKAADPALQTCKAP